MEYVYADLILSNLISLHSTNPINPIHVTPAHVRLVMSSICLDIYCLSAYQMSSPTIAAVSGLSRGSVVLASFVLTFCARYSRYLGSHGPFFM